ncbi:hypothetical protein CEXT_609201 [Caerostris extrusa]|uniref:LAGLIDADG homing endonuclease n=1 Tax=Caerostris extrusa TaxID=172846 RepID=A0AAV4P2K5_CAEEX|nr:hypothetical protein CEXT_609201 [Caerostris extrusa]
MSLGSRQGSSKPKRKGREGRVKTYCTLLRSPRSLASSVHCGTDSNEFHSCLDRIWLIGKDGRIRTLAHQSFAVGGEQKYVKKICKVLLFIYLCVFLSFNSSIILTARR